MTKTRIEQLDKPGLYTVHPTLYIQVSQHVNKQTGQPLPCSKSWIQKIVINHKRREMGLGSFPFVGVDEAKRLAMENRVKAKTGEIALSSPKTATPTFKECALKTIDQKMKGKAWKTPGTTEKNLVVIFGNVCIPQNREHENTWSHEWHAL